MVPQVWSPCPALLLLSRRPASTGPRNPHSNTPPFAHTPFHIPSLPYSHRVEKLAVLDTSQRLCQSIRPHCTSRYVLDRKLVLGGAVGKVVEYCALVVIVE